MGRLSDRTYTYSYTYNSMARTCIKAARKHARKMVPIESTRHVERPWGKQRGYNALKTN